MSKIIAFNHIHLFVHDVKQSVAFYEAVLGLKGPVFDDERGTVAYLRSPQADDLFTLSDYSTEKVGEMGGIDHLGFKLACEEDLDELVSMVEKMGGKHYESGMIGDTKTAFFTDLDGYRIQLSML